MTVTTSADALLADVVAHHDDDTPRLILADRRADGRVAARPLRPARDGLNVLDW